MKTVYVDLGKCSCGKVIVGVNELSFIDHYGRQTNAIEVRGHCGNSGHAERIGTITRQEFDTAKNGEVV